MTETAVQHRESGKRFTARTGSGIAFISYERPDEQTIDLQHTVVPEADRGQGVGAALVEAAFSHASENGLRVIPTCPFVKAWLEKHPEHQDAVK
jgi:predicted GNAT family acetyltransferase